MNGKPIGIIESNYEWASKYWVSRSRDDKKFTLKLMVSVAQLVE